jgi:hypothetical protein
MEITKVLDTHVIRWSRRRALAYVGFVIVLHSFFTVALSATVVIWGLHKSVQTDDDNIKQVKSCNERSEHLAKEAAQCWSTINSQTPILRR